MIINLKIFLSHNQTGSELALLAGVIGLLRIGIDGDGKVELLCVGVGKTGVGVGKLLRFGDDDGKIGLLRFGDGVGKTGVGVGIGVGDGDGEIGLLRVGVGKTGNIGLLRRFNGGRIECILNGVGNGIGVVDDILDVDGAGLLQTSKC